MVTNEQKQQTPIRVCLACDNKFTIHCAQVISSVISNHKSEENLEFYSLNSSISDENLKRLKKMEKNDSVKIFPIKVEASKFKNCPVPEDMYYSLEAYYRLAIPELLFGVEKVIYLDCDVTVLGDIAELWAVDVSGMYAAACKEFSPVSHMSRFMDETLYFNSGVMVINCKKWREENIFLKSMEFVNQNAEHIIYVEQDVLNALLSERIFHLKKCWNFEYMPFNTGVKDLSDEQIKLIHYVSRWKPWNKFGHIYAGIYFKYLAKTPWKWQVLKIKSILALQHRCRPLLMIDCRRRLEHTVKKRKAVLWGASLFISKIIEKYSLKTSDILGIIDVNPEKWGKKIGNYTIFPPHELLNLEPDLVISAVLGQPKMKQKISRELEKFGCNIEINDKLFCNIGEY